jgi:serine/threonine protein kinase/Tfp pilus assembly protein PilF
MIGETVSHYRILEKLGEGGMGVVYRAEDTKLKRSVALKFLPPDLTRDSNAKERFVREAQAASALDHPNICTVYEIDETEDGRTFICMACYDGDTLKTKIEQGPLSLENSIDIASHIARGLSAAHGKEMVHRDIKPGNVFIASDGQVKILDFGLAKLVGQTRLTKTGNTVGTVAYMSPEQARGETVDRQTDIWSLGVVLHEMLTGELPFKSEYEQAALYGILNEDPTSVTALRSEVPEELGQIVSKALAKSPDDRYGSAEDIIADLSRVGEKKESAATGKGILPEPSHLPSIAILPFANLSADKEQDYFCDGMTEEIINVLAQLQGLRVVARTSTFAFRGTDLDAREVGKRLNVERLLEGSVRKAGDTVRITAQLINVSDGYHLWSERYDREMKNVFSIQDEIARSIAGELEVKLGKKEGASLASPRTVDLDAYNLFLEGRFYSNKLTGEGNRKAIELFEQAIGKDPRFAAAYAELGLVHAMEILWENVPPHEGMPKLRELAKKALDIDDRVANAHTAMAIVYFLYDWNLTAAEEEYKKAIELEPNSASAHMYYALFLMTRRRHEEGLAEARFAQKLDPLSDRINAWVGKILAFAGHYDEAIRELDKELARAPEYWNGHLMLSLVHLNEGNAREALEAAERALELAGDSSYPLMQVAMTYYLVGDRTRADELFARLKEKAEGEYVPSMFFVWNHLARGEMEEALRWLDRAFEEHDGWMCFYTLVPMLIPDEPRFLEKFRRIGFEEGRR